MKTSWERIELVLKEKKINANALAKLLGRSVQTFYDMKKKSNVGISKKMAMDIHSLYPDISELWLLAGVRETTGDKTAGNGLCDRCKDKDALIASLKDQIEMLKENNELRNETAILRNKLNT